jgi:hypothetical protein
MLDPGCRIVASSTVLSTELDDELVLMDITTGTYFNLEAVSLEIWRALAKPIAVSELCDRLIATYDAPEERIRTAVLRFLQQLQEHELITVT